MDFLVQISIVFSLFCATRVTLGLEPTQLQMGKRHGCQSITGFTQIDKQKRDILEDTNKDHSKIVTQY